MILEYCILFCYFFFSWVIAILFFFISYIFVSRSLDIEKLSIYECGFSPFEDARVKFEVKYFLVAILFIIFDLEISYLFPWCVVLHSFNVCEFLYYVFFSFNFNNWFYLWVIFRCFRLVIFIFI